MSTQKKQKHYVVRAGHQTGIFDNRPACQQAVSWYTWAQYKSFTSLQDAEWAYTQWYQTFAGKDVRTVLAQKNNTIPWKIPSIAVDAACSWNPGVMEYRGVDVHSGQQLFFSWPWPDATVNIGEFLAIVHALSRCQQNKHDYLCLYTDSRTALSRVHHKKIKTTLTKTPHNTQLRHAIDKALARLQQHQTSLPLIKRDTKHRWEIPADFGRK